MSKPSLPRGTRDFGPDQMFNRNFIIGKIRQVFERYGFQPLETPSMENLSILMGKYGDEGDQLLFKILNSGDFLAKTTDADYREGSKTFTRVISNKGLRYDLTVPFARYVVMHQNEIAFPFKRYQIQPVWRADNPQRGRYREFYQCDADIIGTESIVSDLEIIWLIHDVFKELGLEDFVLKINNRKVLTAVSELIGEKGKEDILCVAIDKLDKIGRDAVIVELKSKGFDDTSCEALIPILDLQGSNEEKLSAISGLMERLDESSRNGLADLQFLLENASLKKDLQLKLDFDISLARGLSYYTGTIFEVKPTTVKMGSITGGGRYDDLTGIFGLPGVSGTGISFGIDRIYEVMNDLKLFPVNQESATRVLITNFGSETLTFSLELLNHLRAGGVNSELYPDASKMKKQFAYANKRGIPYVAVIGPDEVENKHVTLKNMVTGTQEKLAIEDITQSIDL